MALSQYSPGVLVREIDRSTGSTRAIPAYAAIAAPFSQGPVGEVRVISSERQLESVFGKPNDSNYEYWFSAAQYLLYGGTLKVIRTDSTTLKNAVSNGTAVKIKNSDDYENNYEGGSNTWTWAGKTPGTLLNGVRVYATDAGPDQLAVLPAPSSGNEWEFVADEAVTAASGASGKVYSYRVKLKLTSVVGTFVPGAATVDSQAVTVLGWDATKSILDVSIETGYTGITAAADAVAQASSGASGAVATDGITRELRILLDKGSIEFAANDTLTDTNSNTVDISSETVEYQSREVYTGLKWVSIAPRPGTSQFGLSKGAFRDELHLLVVDTEGKVTGTPGTILERHIGLSKATDAKTTNGEVNHIVNALKFGSNHIYAGDLDDTNVMAATATASDGNWGVTAANKNFNIIRAGSGMTDGVTDPVSGAYLVGSKNGPTMQYVLGTAAGTEGVDSYSPTTGEYTTSINLISDPETQDVDFIIPGPMGANTTDALAKANAIINILESRKDCMSFFSPLRSDVIGVEDPDVITENLVKYFRQVPSTSYAALDSGYKYIYDRYNDTYRYIPCSADMAGLCLATSVEEADWYSPAGLQRGVLRNAIKLAYSPNKAQRDQLYVERVNPIVAFPGSGIVLFGDKTALGYASAFDRINVRRLFLLCEKIISQTAQSLLFEFNDSTSRANFINAVEPFLRNIQARRGVQDFLVKCDDENNTDDSVDRGELYAEVYIKPTRTINYITLTFVATKSGVSFEEVAS